MRKRLSDYYKFKKFRKRFLNKDNTFYYVGYSSSADTVIQLSKQYGLKLVLRSDVIEFTDGFVSYICEKPTESLMNYIIRKMNS